MIIRIKILDVSIEVENKDLSHVHEAKDLVGFMNTKAIELYKERVKSIDTIQNIEGKT